MLDFVKRMIDEHAQLFVRICKLNDYVYSEKSDTDDKVEFANKCIQLAAMKKYEEALRARLENLGVRFVDGEYLTSLAKIAFNKPNNEHQNEDENDNPEENQNPDDERTVENGDNLVLE